MDIDLLKHLKSVRITMIQAFIFYLSTVVTFTIFRKKIIFFYEHLLFFDELVVEKEVDKCRIIYEQPIELEEIGIDKGIIAVRDSSSCYRLMYGTIDHHDFSEELVTANTARMLVPCDADLYRTNIPTTHSSGSIEDDASVIETNRKKFLKDDIIDCIICFSKKVNCFFLPCGHSGTCMDCSLSILKTTSKCHICRSV